MVAAAVDCRAGSARLDHACLADFRPCTAAIWRQIRAHGHGRQSASAGPDRSASCGSGDAGLGLPGSADRDESRLDRAANGWTSDFATFALGSCVYRCDGCWAVERVVGATQQTAMGGKSLGRDAGAWVSDRALRRTHLSPDRLQRQLLTWRSEEHTS